MMKYIAISLIFFALSGAVNAQTTESEERINLARKYMALTQSPEQLRPLFAEQVEPIMDAIKRNQPDLYTEKEAVLRQLAADTFFKAYQDASNGFDETMAQIFTTEELKALTIFSESKLGRSVLRKMPIYTKALQPKLRLEMRKAVPQLLVALHKEGVILDDQ